MGIYAKYILPRLLDLAMRDKDMARLRGLWVPKARGEVLELGIGSGLNLRFYSSEVTRVHGVDPSVELQTTARERAKKTLLEVNFLLQSAEEPLELASGSIDTIVTTWTLCSIPDPSKALREGRRVLKPGGRVIFLEHGRSPDARVRTWQDRITPGWKHIAGGCHLNRPIATLLTDAGFRIGELETSYLRGPRPMTFTYQGYAELGPDATSAPRPDASSA
jgi:ubiquinone/menaquinone biosynthesis C-methylase UbiE